MSIICELRGKTSHAEITLVHEEAEDVLVGNVFGIIKNLPPSVILNEWLEKVLGKSIQDRCSWDFSFWERQSIPIGIQEGSTEVDLVLQSDDVIIFVEAKLGAKPSHGTTHTSDRNQLVRNLDVGYLRATKENKGYASIYLTPDLSQPDIVDRIRNQEDSYPANPSIDPQLINQCLFWSSWAKLGYVIVDAYYSDKLNSTEKKFALDLLAYLSHKRLWENSLNDENLFYRHLPS